MNQFTDLEDHENKKASWKTTISQINKVINHLGRDQKEYENLFMGFNPYEDIQKRYKKLSIDKNRKRQYKTFVGKEFLLSIVFTYSK